MKARKTFTLVLLLCLSLMAEAAKPGQKFHIFLCLGQSNMCGVCWRFNVDILPNLPKTLPNSYIISAKDCESTGDQFHFSTEGMRILGFRYAEQMLKLHKYKMKK